MNQLRGVRGSEHGAQSAGCAGAGGGTIAAPLQVAAAHHVPLERGAVKGAAVCEEDAEQLLLPDLVPLKLAVDAVGGGRGRGSSGTCGWAG